MNSTKFRKVNDAQASGAHEPNIVSTKWILIGTAAVVVGIALSFASAGLVVLWMDHHPPARVSARQPPAHEPKRVNSWINPGKELAEVKQTWHDHLETYSWINKNKGIVRIPIEASMHILAAQKQPSQKKGQPGQETQP